MDKTELFTRFFQKTQEDERLLFNRFPIINGFLQAGFVPAIVLQNYDIARNEVNERIAFTRNLMREHVSPQTGVPTPEPILLPGFGLKEGLSGGLGAASTAVHTLPPLAMVSAKDVVILVPSAGPPDSSSGPLGLGPLGVAVVAIIGTTIVVGAIALPFIIAAANEEAVKLAFQKVQLEQQKNFARIWDTAQNLVQKCVGATPTPEQLKLCWETVAQRFPEIAKAIPAAVPPDTGGGLLKTLGTIVVVGGVVAAGFFGVRAWQRNSDKRSAQAMDKRRDEREHKARLAAMRTPRGAPGG